MINNNLRLLGLIITCVTLIKCGKDSDDTRGGNAPSEQEIDPISKPDEPMSPLPIGTTPPSNPTLPSTPTEVPNNFTTNYADKVDLELFKQLKGHVDYYAKGEFYTDFVLGEYPMYLIQTDGGTFSNTGDPIKGFIFNPKEVLPEMKRLGNNESYGLNIYRYDDIVKKATQDLIAGNGLFKFGYTINNKKGYYLQTYGEAMVLGSNNSSAITTISHEAFHDMHQDHGLQNPNWVRSEEWTQDRYNFPFTKELVELQILVSEIFIDFPNVTDKEILRDKLKQYVAIRSKELELDTSEKQLIRNMSLVQERIEGGAYLAEISAKRDYFGKKHKILWNNLWYPNGSQ